MGLLQFSAGANAVAADVNANFNECRNYAILSFVGLVAQAKVSVSNVAASNTFANNKKYILLNNAGSTTIYVDFEVDATANSWDVAPGEYLELFGVFSKISAITASGTSTLKILGYGDTTDIPTTKVYNVSCTSTNSSQAVTANTKQVIMKNTGSNIVYVNIDAAATTDHMGIQPGSTLTIGKNVTTTAQFICDTAKTSTIKMLEVREW
jgi:hypothetical protein